jgi:restriction system protein
VLFIGMALLGQFILPIIFLIGAVFSVILNRKRGKLMSKTASNPSAAGLNDMSWGEFEMLVGEYFRRKGYSVIETGGRGPDGGVDLELKKDKELFFVQCKQWRAIMSRSIQFVNSMASWQHEARQAGLWSRQVGSPKTLHHLLLVEI